MGSLESVRRVFGQIPKVARRPVTTQGSRGQGWGGGAESCDRIDQGGEGGDEPAAEKHVRASDDDCGPGLQFTAVISKLRSLRKAWSTSEF